MTLPLNAPLDESTLERVRDALCAGRKIEAVRLYHGAAGTGLAAAKTAVDAMERELRKSWPDRFPKPGPPVPMASALAALASLITAGTLSFLALMSGWKGDAATGSRYGAAASTALLVFLTIQSCYFCQGGRFLWLGRAGLLCVLLLMSSKVYQILHG